MVVVIFRSRLTAPASPPAGEEYAKTAPRMLQLAESMPGFVSFKAFTAADGERVSIIEFESEDTLKAWREHPEHRRAQQRGRELFYEEYRLQVCVPQREARFTRNKGESKN